MRSIFLSCVILACFTAIKCVLHDDYSDFGDTFDSPEDDDEFGRPLYLTRLIEKGKFKKARHSAIVRHPDFSFHSYAGYLTVNKEYNSNLFFWYVPARVNPEKAPVMLWLQGGPGTPSSFALFLENGPYFLTKKQKLVENKYSWCINHHMLYIDSPVGTGYSFTESDAGYARNQKDVGHNLLVALRQFFLLFPDLQKNDFYVAGESYGGKYVPGIGYAILQDSAREDFDQKKPKINLKGLGIANGLSDPIHQLNYGDFLYQLGLIDTNGLDLFKKYESQGVDCLKRRDLDCAFKTYDELIIGTEVSSTVFGNLTGFTNYYNYLIAKAEDYSFFDTYVQRYDIRRAIHVGNNSYASSDGAGLVASYLRLDFYDTVAPWVSELLSHYPIFVYNGALDVACAYSLAENYLKHLDFDAAHEYKTAKRCIWRVNEEIAGYMKHAGNLTEVMVRNAGHTSSRDQPEWLLDMILRLTHPKTHQLNKHCTFV